jgi:hypothetical protein
MIRRACAFAAIGVSIVIAPSIASADIYLERVTPQNDRCYQVNYHQQVDQVNTRGRLISGPSRSFVPSIVKQVGGTARDVYNPAIYLTTRRMVRPEYYSMVPTGC